MRKSLSALTLAAVPAMLSAQVSLYEYSESVEPYTEVTAAEASYSLGEPTFSPPLYNNRAWVNNAFFEPNGQSNVSYLNPAIGPGYPIGFPFTFNGEVFDVLSVSNSGFITFGKSSDGNQAVWTYAISHPHARPFVQSFGGPSVPYKRNRVAGWANEGLYMQNRSPLVPPGPVSSIRIATIGTMPNRVCVVQFKDFCGGYPPNSTLINFQIRLNEADNSVEVRFGEVVFAYAAGGSTQIGLGGALPEDFNSRRTVYEEPAFLYDWNATAAGETNEDACVATEELFNHPNGSGVPPVLGRTFKWSPSVCPPPSWPLTITDISFDAGHAIWTANTAGEYEYFVTDTNTIDGPEISSGITNDPEAYFFGLEASTMYYVFVRSICDGVPGEWSLATPFETFGGGLVECDGGVVTENFCSEVFSTKEWLYSSADGSMLRIEFLAGVVSTGQNAYFKVWEGTSDAGTLLYTSTGQVTGQAFNAQSGSLFIRLISDAGACHAQDWFYPLEWRVGCKNCTDPLVNFNLGTVDCDNQQFYVDVDVYSLGSAPSLSLENSSGLPATVITATGLHEVGPFPSGQTVVITAQNPDNLMCYAASVPIMGAPCPIIDCGPTTYTVCYADNDHLQWAYQGANGQEIGIRFLKGTIGLGDNGKVYKGLDIQNIPSDPMPSGLLNALFTSGPSSTDQALVMELIADDAVSCQDEDPMYGASQEWKYVVACYDGCIQPKATFADSCISTNAFMVNVTVTDIGSTGSVTITSSSGATPVTATATGTYTVGPFQANVPVTLDVEGASILCTYTSTGRSKDCSDWMEPDGINELATAPLRLFPNPSNGTFQVELPQGSGISQVDVTDLTGRIVAKEAVNSNNTSATLRLEHLPNGLYTVVAQGAQSRYLAKVSIQH